MKLERSGIPEVDRVIEQIEIALNVKQLRSVKITDSEKSVYFPYVMEGAGQETTTTTDYSYTISDMTKTFTLERKSYVRVTFNGVFGNDTLGKAVLVAFFVDGNQDGKSAQATAPANDYRFMLGLYNVFELDKGEHTIAVRMKVDGNTGYSFANRVLVVEPVDKPTHQLEHLVFDGGLEWKRSGSA
jgi:hypothetical protein